MRELITIFVAPGSIELDDVAARIFQLLGIQVWEQRYSDNYPPRGYYHIGFAQNGRVSVYEDDSQVMPHFPIQVCVKDPAGDHANTASVPVSAKELAKAIASGGFATFVPRGDWCRTDWDGAGETYTA